MCYGIFYAKFKQYLRNNSYTFKQTIFGKDRHELKKKF